VPIFYLSIDDATDRSYRLFGASPATGSHLLKAALGSRRLFSFLAQAQNSKARKNFACPLADG
jgi:hypothetical protein